MARRWGGSEPQRTVGEEGRGHTAESGQSPEPAKLVYPKTLNYRAQLDQENL